MSSHFVTFNSNTQIFPSKSIENKKKKFSEYIKSINCFIDPYSDYYTVFTMMDYPVSLASFNNEFKKTFDDLPILSFNDIIEIETFQEENTELIETEIDDIKDSQYHDSSSDNDSDSEFEVCEKYRNGFKYI